MKDLIASIKAMREHPLVKSFAKKASIQRELNCFAWDTKSSATDGYFWMKTKS